MAMNKQPIKMLIVNATLTAGSFIIRPNFMLCCKKIPDLLAGDPRGIGSNDAQGRSFSSLRIVP